MQASAGTTNCGSRFFVALRNGLNQTLWAIAEIARPKQMAIGNWQTQDQHRGPRRETKDYLVPRKKHAIQMVRPGAQGI